MVYNPWRRLARHPDWLVIFDDLPPGTLGHTDWASKTITLAAGQYQRERRCTIDHEVEHVRRGPIHGDDPRDHAREEATIDRLVAHRLLPDIKALVDELIFHDWHLEPAAEALWVDADTLAARLGSITHPAEQAYLRRRIDDHHAHHQCTSRHGEDPAC